jgi:hypothetical protein
VSWEWLDRAGLEVAVVRSDSDSVRIEGRVVSAFESTPFQLSYELRCEPRWEIVEARIELRMADRSKNVHLQRDGERWRVNDKEQPHLENCADIDIMATPSTNSLPIRRLAWEVGQARVLSMAYVRLPDLQVLRSEQRYTRLEHADRAAQRFRYESLSSGFTAELCVDADGLVLDYPPSWRRIAIRSTHAAMKANTA